MLKSYWKILLRNFKRNKLGSILTIFGLAIGLALVFLIVLYIRFETTYDTYNNKADRIYRVLRHNNDLDWLSPGTSCLLGQILREEYPGIEKVAQVRRIAADIEVNDELEREFFTCVDPDIFDILTLEFLSGNKKNALTEPYDILLSETSAAKYFPNEDPVGKILRVKMYVEMIDFTVKGVLKDLPKNSTVAIPFLVRREISEKLFYFLLSRYGDKNVEYSINAWWSTYFETYILLKEQTNVEYLAEQLNKIPARHHDEDINASYELQPLRDIYLHSDHLTNNFTISGKINDIYLFSSIAFLILFIAAANFIILSTAHSIKRTKEIAVKKVVGAERKILIGQILFESVVTSLIACFLAVGLTYLLRSGARYFLHVPFEINYLDDYIYPVSLFVITLLVGLVSGSYLAFYITRLNPLDILRNRKSTSGSRSLFTRAVISLQMVIFISLISASLIIFKQFNFVKNEDMGFNKEQLLILSLTSGDFSEHIEAFIEELKLNPNIISVTSAYTLPPDDSSTVGQISVYDDPEQLIQVEYYDIYYNFFETLGIEFIKGRSFSQEFTGSFRSSVILNQSAVEKLHIDDPIGKTFENAEIIGIVKDFHFHSLYDEIEPMCFYLADLSKLGEIGIKLTSQNIPETIKYIKATWENFNKSKDTQFKYSFVDEVLDWIYRDTKAFGKAIIYCSIFAVFVACLGLFGFTKFMTEQKTKEIGIRKVFGASPFRIFKHLTLQIIWLNLISTIIAIPFVLFLMSKWLQNFAYQTHIGFWIFIKAGILALFISLITMSFYSIRAALTNPIETMKYE